MAAEQGPTFEFPLNEMKMLTSVATMALDKGGMVTEAAYLEVAYARHTVVNEIRQKEGEEKKTISISQRHAELIHEVVKVATLRGGVVQGDDHFPVALAKQKLAEAILKCREKAEKSALPTVKEEGEEKKKD